MSPASAASSGYDPVTALWWDRKFHELPFLARAQKMADLDPDFAALPPDKQSSLLTQSYEKFYVRKLPPPTPQSILLQQQGVELSGMATPPAVPVQDVPKYGLGTPPVPGSRPLPIPARAAAARTPISPRSAPVPAPAAPPLAAQTAPISPPNGGTVKPPGLGETRLTPEEEVAFQEWALQAPFNVSPTAYRDLRGAWKGSTAWNAPAHPPSASVAGKYGNVEILAEEPARPIRPAPIMARRSGRVATTPQGQVVPLPNSYDQTQPGIQPPAVPVERWTGIEKNDPWVGPDVNPVTRAINMGWLGAAQGAITATAGMAGGLAQAAGGIVGPNRVIGQHVVSGEGLRQAGQDMSAVSSALGQTPEGIAVDPLDDPSVLAKPEWWSYAIGQGLGSMAPMLATGMGAGAAVNAAVQSGKLAPRVAQALVKWGQSGVGGVTEGLQAGSLAYDEAVREGKSESEALERMAIVGAGTAATSAAALKAGVFSDAIQSRAVRGGVSAVAGGGQEVVQTGIENVVGGRSFTEGMVQAGVAGTIGEGAVGAAMGAGAPPPQPAFDPRYPQGRVQYAPYTPDPRDAGPVPKGPRTAEEAAQAFTEAPAAPPAYAEQGAPYPLPQGVRSAQESAAAFEQELPRQERRQEQEQQRQELRAQRPVVPETGIPEEVARGVAAREDLAQQILQKPWSTLSNAERIGIDDLIAEGYTGATGVINESQNVEGLPGQVGIRQEPQQAQPVQRSGGQAAQTGRSVQSQGQKEEVAPPPVAPINAPMPVDAVGAPAPPAAVRRVQRIEEPGTERASFDKPHGIYTSPVDVESPHADLGGERFHWTVNPEAKVLTIHEEMVSNPLGPAYNKIPNPEVVMRRGANSAGTGVWAARELLGSSEFTRLKKLDKSDLIAHAQERFPTVEWTKYYDKQEVMEGLGGMLARAAGYDAVDFKSATPAFDEFVGLTNRSMSPEAAETSSAGARKKPAPIPGSRAKKRATPPIEVEPGGIPGIIEQEQPGGATPVPAAGEPLPGTAGEVASVPEPGRPVGGLAGATAQVRVPGEKATYQTRYAVREAADVIASHSGLTFQKNPRYQWENERNYEDTVKAKPAPIPSRRARKPGEAGFLMLGGKQKPLSPKFTLSNAEAQDRITKAGKPPTRPDKAAEAWEAVRNVGRAFARTYQHLPTKQYAQLIYQLKQAEKASSIASHRAKDYLMHVGAGLDANQHEALRVKLIIDDLGETYKKWEEEGTLPYGADDMMKMAFGLTPADIRTDGPRIDAHIEADPKLKESLAAYERAFDEVKSEFIPAMKAAGDEDVEEIFSRLKYLRHRVLQHIVDNKRSAKGSKGKPASIPSGQSWTKERSVEAREEDFSSDIVTSTFEVLRQMMHDTKTAKLMAWIGDPKNDLNILADLKKQAKDLTAEARKTDPKAPEVDWEKLIPETHKKWQPGRAHVFYTAHTVPERIAQEVMQRIGEDVGISKDDLREVLALGGRRAGFVLPKEVADTLENIGGPLPTEAQKVVSKIMGLWKQINLFGPERAPHYFTRNLFSDADKTLHNPTAFPKLSPSLKDLVAYATSVRKGKPEMSENLRGWFDHGGFATSQQIAQIGDLRDTEHLEKLYEQLEMKQVPAPIPAARRVARAAVAPPAWVLKKWFAAARIGNDAREAWGRYANYLSYLEQAKSGKLENYGASDPEAIDKLETPEDKAWKLSNDLINPYDEQSVAAQHLRKWGIPFFPFTELNTKSHIGLLKNAWRNKKLMVYIGKRIAGPKSLYSAYRIGRFATGMSALWVSLQALNNWLFPDEEKKLRKEVQGLPHVIMGKSADGSITYFPNVGNAQEFEGWVGTRDMVSLGRDVINGRLGAATALKKWFVRNPWNKFVQGIGPFPKNLLEASLGRSTYPSVEKPREIYDAGRYLARTVGLGPVYDRAFGLPRRQTTWTEKLLNWVAYTTDPDESADADTRTRLDEWLVESGEGAKGGGGGRQSLKAEALRNMRGSLRMKDPVAFAKYIQDYANTGGTEKGLQQSIKMMHPLAGLNKQQKDDFIDALNEDELKRLQMAIDYWEKTFSPEHVNDFMDQAVAATAGK